MYLIPEVLWNRLLVESYVWGGDAGIGRGPRYGCAPHAQPGARPVAPAPPIMPTGCWAQEDDETMNGLHELEASAVSHAYNVNRCTGFLPFSLCCRPVVCNANDA